MRTARRPDRHPPRQLRLSGLYEAPPPRCQAPACRPGRQYAANIWPAAPRRASPEQPSSRPDRRCSSHRSAAPPRRRYKACCAHRTRRRRRDLRALLMAFRTSTPMNEVPRRPPAHFPQCAAPASRDGRGSCCRPNDRHVAAGIGRDEIRPLDVGAGIEPERDRPRAEPLRSRLQPAA